MREVSASAVVMGQDVLAGLDDDNLSIIRYGIMLSFTNKEELRSALYGEARININSLFDDHPPPTIDPQDTHADKGK